MAHRIKSEIAQLVKLGIDENVAKLGVYHKYGMVVELEQVQQEMMDENQCLAEDTKKYLMSDDEDEKEEEEIETGEERKEDIPTPKIIQKKRQLKRNTNGTIEVEVL
jgi:hypothetical protein